MERTETVSDRLRFFSYNQWIRSRFGSRVHRVTVDAGFTCPNRDGTVAVGGCVYCNNDGFSPASHNYRTHKSLAPSQRIGRQIAEALPALKRRFHTDRFLAYFQAYSNTYAPVDVLRRLYLEALDQPGIIGLAIGTRPDCVEESKLDLLEELGRRCYVSVEYGCESIHDETLQWANRGHDFACFVDAVQRTAARGIDVGAHLILGFPVETRDRMLEAAPALSSLPVRFLKLHNLHIVKGTALAHRYRIEPFRLLDLEEYVQLLADFLERLSPRVAVQRLYGDAPDALLVAPRWDVDGPIMAQRVHQELERRESYQGSKALLEF